MKRPKTEVDVNSKESFLVPKLWHGMNFGAWLGLLRKGNYRVSPSRWPMALMVTLFSINNSVMGSLQSLLYRRKIAQTPVNEGPIFVIGHYRSGTTLLQELLCSDPRHTYPTTYECFAPHHFLLTERWFARWLNLILPKQRLADRMLQGTDRPQEDEAAMCCLGMPSRFHRFAFPNKDWDDSVSPDLDHQSDATIAQWKWQFRQFLQAITFRRNKRIVLKSPQHTCRIKHLAELFPNAKFVYIVRDPMVVFPSTVRLWQVIHESQSLQVPTHQGLEEVVINEFNEMHRLVQRDQATLGENQFCCVHYENLVADPMAEVKRVYDTLSLEDFEQARDGIASYLSLTKGYQTNRYDLSDEERENIQRQWADFCQTHGYVENVERETLEPIGS